MHRDLKLENLLLDGSDLKVLKIADFGYSKVRPASAPALALAGNMPSPVWLQSMSPWDPWKLSCFAPLDATHVDGRPPLQGGAGGD